MDCFVIYTKEVKTRLDPFYLKNISFVRNFKTMYPRVPLGNLLKEKPQYGANEPAIDGNPQKDIRYIRITDIDEFGNLKNDDWKTAKSINEKYLLKENDLLFARSGATAGKTFIYKKEFGKAIFAGYLIRLKIDYKKVNPLFVFYYTQLKRYAMWVKSIQRPSGQPNINSEEFKALEIPIPPVQIQNSIIRIMQSAYERKRRKEKEAEELLNSFEELILKEIGLRLPEVRQSRIFTIKVDNLDGALNPERYANKFKLSGSLEWINIRNIGFVNRETRTPSRANPETKYSLIRIDDLESHPKSAVIRYVEGKEIPGTVLAVEPDDVLIARLGPTIENKKSIRVPGSEKPLVASTEFIDLRCNEQNNPIFVLSMLKTDFYKKTMIQKARGATPSRRRLSHEDFAKLPFPKVDLDVQNRIAEEVKKRISVAKKLQLEANSVVEKAKQEAEDLIMGKTK